MTGKWNFSDGRSLTFGNRTLVMGILNVTHDSFSDGGMWDNVDAALSHAREMVEDGADVIDIGAESSRPGFQPISAEEEIERLRPFLAAVIHYIPVPVSVDTFKARTADFALSEGAHMINDIWGLQYAREPNEMARVVARHRAPVILMHNQDGTDYDGDIMEAIKEFFRRSFDIAVCAGIDENHIMIDPGIGFGKTVEHNIEVIRRLGELTSIDGRRYPLLLGASRKSFIGKTLDLDVSERDEATGATCVMGIERGANIVRVHDVKMASRMCRMTDIILGVGANGQNKA